MWRSLSISSSPNSVSSMHSLIKLLVKFEQNNWRNVSFSSLSGSVFSLDNEAWSGNKKSGDVIAFSLLGDYTDSDPDDPINIESVSLNNVLLC